MLRAEVMFHASSTLERGELPTEVGDQSEPGRLSIRLRKSGGSKTAAHAAATARMTIFPTTTKCNIEWRGDVGSW